MLHHRIFEPSTHTQEDGHVGGGTGRGLGDSASRLSEAAFVTPGVSTGATQATRRNNSGLTLAQHAVLIRGFRVWCESCFIGESKDGLNIDLAQPLFAGALLTLLDIEAKGSSKMMGGPGDAANQSCAKNGAGHRSPRGSCCAMCAYLSNTLTGADARGALFVDYSSSFFACGV